MFLVTVQYIGGTWNTTLVTADQLAEVSTMALLNLDHEGKVPFHLEVERMTV